MSEYREFLDKWMNQQGISISELGATAGPLLSFVQYLEMFKAKDMSDKLLSEETKVLNSLADAWNLFIAMPELHQSDRQEFMQAIHAAQNIIMARPAYKELYPFWKEIMDKRK
jgi:hypothetical protein